ncbi:MAG TPA: histidine--tRNA ligase [Oscillatoriaceae cyanobacterium]
MANLVSPIKGFKDLVSGVQESRHNLEEWQFIGRWQFVERIARELLPTYRYGEIRTPVLERTELFSRGIGENTDIVGKEMFSFTARGEREVTMRPENTAGVVRSYVEHKLYTLPGPQKFWYLGPMFRNENVQAGRYRQFHQLGVECFGSDDPRVDAEIIVLATDLLARLGLTGLEVQLNSVGCSECRPAYREALQGFLRQHQEALCENCVTRTEKNPLRVLDCKVETCGPVIRQAPPLSDYLCEACRNHQAGVIRYVESVKLPYVLNPRLVRGLDYYTRTVFEVVSGALGAQNTVLAGGRYNGLVEELGGPSTPAVGWGLGMERLIMLLSKSLVPEEYLDALFMPTTDDAELVAFQLAHQMREAGLRVEVASPGKLGNLFKQAERLRARFGVILGEDELAAKSATVKNLEKREQATVPQLELAGWLKQTQTGELV